MAKRTSGYYAQTTFGGKLYLHGVKGLTTDPAAAKVYATKQEAETSRMGAKAIPCGRGTWPPSA